MVKHPKIKTEKKNDDDDIVAMDVGSAENDNAMVVDEVPSSGNVGMQTGSEKDENDDDEIIQEIPVFLSPALSDQIQLIQYPLHQNKHPTEPEAVRVKPRHCMIEIDLQTPDNIQSNGLYHMPNRTLVSQTIPVSTHMALGKMVAHPETGEIGLHLVPLSRMTQMRPSFSHIDQAAMSSQATTEAELRQREQTEQSAGRKSITFRKKESERQELARKSSYGYKKSSEEAEGWHSLEVYDQASLQANLVMEKVTCPLEHQNRNLLDVATLEKEGRSSMNQKIPGTTLNAAYLNTLNYLPPRDDFGTTSVGGMDNAKSANDQADLSQIVKKLVRLMRLGRPIPFSLLRAEFPKPSSGGISDTTLFVALGSCAVFVRGNWCLNSKLLSYSPAIAQARTFMMCVFQSMRVVHRERLTRVFVEDAFKQKTGPEDDEYDGEIVTPEVIDMLLEQLGEKTREGWVLKVADDVTFAEKHPQTTLVHLEYWAKQIDLFQSKLEMYREDF